MARVRTNPDDTGGGTGLARDGANRTLVGIKKMPDPGSHTKYRSPYALPSLRPNPCAAASASNSMPIQVPVRANTGPMYRTTPTASPALTSARTVAPTCKVPAAAAARDGLRGAAGDGDGAAHTSLKLMMVVVGRQKRSMLAAGGWQWYLPSRASSRLHGWWRGVACCSARDASNVRATR